MRPLSWVTRIKQIRFTRMRKKYIEFATEVNDFNLKYKITREIAYTN